MTDQELQQLVKSISLDTFQKPFLHRATFNSRLRTTAGRYLLKTHNLEFNVMVNEKHGVEELIGIIKHELCHYHLHLEQKGYKHKDKDFKECLAKTKGSRYAKPLENKKENFNQYQIVCKRCGFVYNRKRKVNTAKYRCGKCHGPLQLKS